MKTKEKSIFLFKDKKIQLFKNINVNLKCVKAQKIKLDIKINQNITNKILNSNPTTTYNNSIKTIINNNFQKSLNIINVKKLPPKNKTNNKRSKSTKSFSMNNSNKSNLKRNFIIKRNSKNLINNITYKNSSKNRSKSEYYKKINIVTNNNSSNKTKKSKNNSKSHKLSPISRPIKLIRNNAPINQNNPMELTFGSSSFMSNNLQTETNETDKDKDKDKEKNTIKIKNKFRKRNNSFMKTINSKKEFKDKNNLNIKKNKILKLNKKLFLRPSWKISANKSKYKPPKFLNINEVEKNKEDKNNKSAFIIENYNKKTRYSANAEKIMYYKNNNITDITSNKNSKKDITINIKKFSHQDKNLKNKFINFYKKNLLRNKIFNNRNDIEIDTNNSYGIKKINIKSYSHNDSSFFDNNLKYKNKNKNINPKNKNNKLDESRECIIKINKSVDKENGKFKLIIKRTVADKCIRKMPKSTPKLLLTHPSFKKMFF